MPRDLSGPSPSQMYEGRKTPNRPTSLMWLLPHFTSTSSAPVLGIALSEEGVRSLQHVLACEDALRCVQLGGQARVQVQVHGGIDQPLCLSHGEWAASGDLIRHRLPRPPPPPRGPDL